MRRRLVFVSVMVALACVDVAYKLVTRADYHHVRSPFAAVAMSVVVAGLIVFVPRLPSDAALLGGAVAAGGALGNLVSVLVWAQGVPDPIVLQGATHGIAFNLADVFAFAGDSVLLSAVVVYAVRRRERLRQPV